MSTQRTRKRKLKAATLHRKARTLTADQYDAMLAAQNGCCALCANTPKTRRLDVDHCHTTMQIRGLLCHRCNRALPNWITPEWLRTAANYLEAHA